MMAAKISSGHNKDPASHITTGMGATSSKRGRYTSDTHACVNVLQRHNTLPLPTIFSALDRLTPDHASPWFAGASSSDQLEWLEELKKKNG
ncbi:hypothetical protein ACS0TY_000130 [Phlomoides rotata]